MQSTKKQRYEKRFFLSLFIIVLVLFAIVIVYNNKKVTGEQTPTETETAQAAAEAQAVPVPDQLGVVSGMVYRHLVAYDLVCREAGHPLTKYPDYFSNQFLPEIQAINTAWAHRGKSLESVLTDYDSLIYPATKENIQEELLNIERNFIKSEKAKDAGISPDQVEWGEQQESALSLSDACMVFDEAGEGMIEKSGFEKIFRELMQGL